MNFITETILLSVLTGVGGWFAARRRNKAETKRIEIENSELVNTVLQKNIAMLNEQFEKAINEIQALRAENLALRRTIYELETFISKKFPNESTHSDSNIDHVP